MAHGVYLDLLTLFGLVQWIFQKGSVLQKHLYMLRGRAYALLQPEAYRCHGGGHQAIGRQTDLYYSTVLVLEDLGSLNLFVFLLETLLTMLDLTYFSVSVSAALWFV